MSMNLLKPTPNSDYARSCPPPATVTVTTTVPLPEVTMVLSDAGSIYSAAASASSVDSLVWFRNSQNAPINQPWSETMTWSQTLIAPAAVGTYWPDHGTSILYHYESHQEVPILTTAITIGPEPPNVIYTTTTITLPGRAGAAGSSVARAEKRELTSPSVSGTAPSLSVVPGATCSMIFAQINGQWASWCNNYNGHTAVSLPSSFATTTLLTSVYGAPPVPESVIHQSSSHLMAEPVTTSIVFTAEVTITAPVTTITTPGHPSSSHQPGSESSATQSTSSTPSAASTPVASSETPSSNASMTTLQGTTSVSSTAPAGTSCGQVGSFIVGFDDLPVYYANDPTSFETPEVPTPYDHFAWSAGFEYGPPGPQAYLPHSSTRLGAFDPMDPDVLKPPTIGSMMAGSFGAGLRAFNNIYYFDASSAFVGCNNTASTTKCQIVATAYQWRPDNASLPTIGQEHVVDTQYFSPPTCATKENCTLTQITFAPTFIGLSSINLYAKVNGAVVGFFIDDIALTWSNNTCGAGLARITSRKR